MYSKCELGAFNDLGKKYVMILSKNQSFHINKLSVIRNDHLVNTFEAFAQAKIPKFKILKARF